MPQINLRDYADPELDDCTAGVLSAFAAAGGGGEVFIPPGRPFTVRRKRSETPILPIPAGLLLRGTGQESCIRLHYSVNDTNGWCLLGSKQTCAATFRDFRLAGSNLRGVSAHENPQCHLIFFDIDEGSSDGLTMENLLLHDTAGDCVCLRNGCRVVRIRNVIVEGYVRHGVSLGGGNNARDMVLTGIIENRTFKAQGNTIHIEDALDLTDVTIADCFCPQGIAAGNVRNLHIHDSHVEGRIVGANVRGGRIHDNDVLGEVLDKNGNLLESIEFSYSDYLSIHDNRVDQGICVRGSRSVPAKDIEIHDNRMSGRITLANVAGAWLHHNRGFAPPLLDRVANRHIEEWT